MDQFLQMNIFFFVTTIVAIAVGVLVALILWRVWKIAGHIERVSEMAEEEGTLIRGDIHELRKHMREGGARVRPLMRFFTNIARRFFGESRD